MKILKNWPPLRRALLKSTWPDGYNWTGNDKILWRTPKKSLISYACDWVGNNDALQVGTVPKSPIPDVLNRIGNSVSRERSRHCQQCVACLVEQHTTFWRIVFIAFRYLNLRETGTSCKSIPADTFHRAGNRNTLKLFTMSKSTRSCFLFSSRCFKSFIGVNKKFLFVTLG